MHLGCKSRKRIVTQDVFAKLFSPLRLVNHLAGHAAVDNNILPVDVVEFHFIVKA